MILNIARCPHCGGTDFAVQVMAWLNIGAADDHSDDNPRFDDATAEFDPEDAGRTDPLDDSEIICRNPECCHIFANTAAEPPQ